MRREGGNAHLLSACHSSSCLEPAPLQHWRHRQGMARSPAGFLAKDREGRGGGGEEGVKKGRVRVLAGVSLAGMGLVFPSKILA